MFWAIVGYVLYTYTYIQLNLWSAKIVKNESEALALHEGWQDQYIKGKNNVFALQVMFD